MLYIIGALVIGFIVFRSRLWRSNPQPRCKYCNCEMALDYAVHLDACAACRQAGAR